MKTSLTLTLVGAACALLVSCGTQGRETVYVTSESGEPICGAVVVPCDTPSGCTDPVYTDPCGKARLPGGSDSYSIEKTYFRTVDGVQSSEKPQHIIMQPGWPN